MPSMGKHSVSARNVKKRVKKLSYITAGTMLMALDFPKALWLSQLFHAPFTTRACEPEPVCLYASQHKSRSGASFFPALTRSRRRRTFPEKKISLKSDWQRLSKIFVLSRPNAIWSIDFWSRWHWTETTFDQQKLANCVRRRRRQRRRRRRRRRRRLGKTAANDRIREAGGEGNLNRRAPNIFPDIITFGMGETWLRVVLQKNL